VDSNEELLAISINRTLLGTGFAISRVVDLYAYQGWALRAVLNVH